MRRTRYTAVLLHVLTVALGLLTASHCALAATPAYTISDLGVPSGYNVTPAGINASGQVALSGYPGSGLSHLYISQNGLLSDLGTFGGSTVAEAINDAGQIAGWNVTASANHALLYSGGQFTDLYSLGGLLAYGINSTGQVVGDAVLGTSGIAFVYSNGVLTDLSPLPNGTSSSAHAINDAGQIVGYSYNASGVTHATVWQNGQVTDLGTLGGSFSRALAISNGGLVVGIADTVPPSQNYFGPSHAFVWQKGVMTDLGTLSGGGESIADAVNNVGVIVGGAATIQKTYYPHYYHAVRWSRGQIHDLNDDLPAASGWVLQKAVGINASGQIVGDGTLNGQYHPFLLTPTPTQLAGLAPSYALAGGPAFTLTLMGSGFQPGATVTWNGAALTTTYVSDTQLTASVPATDIAAPGTASVAAVNPSGAATAPLTFTINAPTLLSSLFVGPSPIGGGATAYGYLNLKSTAPAGGLLVSLSSDNAVATVFPTVTVQGGQTFASFPITTRSILPSLTPVTAHISATDGGAPVTANLEVDAYGVTGLTITPGNVFAGDSATGTASINAPAPAEGLILTLSSNNAAVTVFPTVMVPAGATSVSFPIHTTVISQEVSPFIGVAYGNTSSGNFFSLVPRPTLTALSPSSATAGSLTLSLIVSGTNFIPGASQVYWNGAALPWVSGTGTQIVATVPAALLTTPGTARVAVGDYRGPSRTPSLPFTIRPIVSTVVQINAGGGAAPPFTADAGFSGGRLYSTRALIDTSAVSSPAPQAVYQTERYGNFTYTVPNLTPGAAYTVRLHFAEIYWNAVGQRVFSVAINGSPVLTNFDVFQTAGGKNKAVAPSFRATADRSGRIILTFQTIKNNAKVSGIEVLTAG